MEAKGAFFRSLQDPIDTASPQGKFTLQVLGAAAIGGCGPATRWWQLTRTDGYLERLNQTAQDWVPQVRRLRPDMAWKDVLRLINTPLPPARRWSQGRLLCAVRAYVREGFLPETILGRAGRRESDDHLPAIIAVLREADPGITLQAICARLEAMREPMPRGRSRGQPSSVRIQLGRAKRLGLL